MANAYPEEIFKKCNLGMVITNEHGYIREVNPAFLTLTCLKPSRIIGQPIYKLDSEFQHLVCYRQIWRSLKKHGFWQGERWLKKADNTRFPALVNISSIKSRDTLANFIIFISDLSEQQHRQEKLQYLAYYDLLTGLPNRTLFNDRLTVAIDFAKRNSLQLAILFIDLDNFKAINDELGHLAADQILKCVSHRMKKEIRESDTIARFGGDEFIIILNNTKGKTQVKEIAEKLKSIICSPITVNQQVINVNISIGISLYPEHDSSSQGLQYKADLAMYRAKRARSHGIDLFDPVQATFPAIDASFVLAG